MRQVLIGVVALMLGGVAFAQDYTSSEYCDPWCEGVSGVDCSYHNLQQCLTSARGSSIHCYENPFLNRCRRPAETDRSLHRRR